MAAISEVHVAVVETEDIRRYAYWTVGILFAFAIISEFTYRKISPAPKVLETGKDVDVSITLISTDAKALSCASSTELAGLHCEFQTRTERWKRDPNRPPRSALALEPLVPYKTTDDITLLVPGLFSQPALRERLVIDPPNFAQEHIRFVANCKMHVEGKMPELEIRWAQAGAWQTHKDVWVGSVSGCFLSDG